MQVLVAISKKCKPNSPKPWRAWTKVEPLYGIPEFGNALAALIRAGYLQRSRSFSVKPSPAGYSLIYRWRFHRGELLKRPILFTRVMWDNPIELITAA